MPKNCPVCGLVSPDNALACDCGYSFQYAGTVGRMQLSAAGRRNMLLGILGVVGGLVGTLFSVFVTGSPRGILYCTLAGLAGLVLFVRGSAQVSAHRRRRTPTSKNDQV